MVSACSDDESRREREDLYNAYNHPHNWTAGSKENKLGGGSWLATELETAVLCAS